MSAVAPAPAVVRGDARARSGRLRRVPAWLPATALAAALGAAYLIAAPPAADLAAAEYRSDLFSRAGLTLWDNGWYGGHHLPGYSLLSPALGALLGPRLLLVLATLMASAAFAAISELCFGRAAGLVAGLWFALGAGVGMLSGRVPYTLGLAIGLLALLLALRGRRLPADALALVCALASPVAGAFLALAGLTGAVVSGRGRRLGWLVLAACALLPALALALVFPEGGYEPFAASAFWPALAGVIAVGLLAGADQPAVRAGAGLYAAALIASYALHTPVGGNAARLGALFAGPLLAGSLWRRRRLVLALAAPALLYWQLVTPIRDVVKVAGDPSVHASYYAPLISELDRLTGGHPERVEVPLTGTHSEANLLAGRVLLARGWERQLDTRYGALFYRPALTAGAYRAWLDDNAVAYVALPDVRLDHAAAAEGRIVSAGLPDLRPVWRSPHWRLFAVTGARPLVSPPGRILSVAPDRFSLSAPRAGSYDVRVRFTPYWALSSGHGCVTRAPGGWTQVSASTAGTVRVGIDFALGRVLDHSRRCR